MKYRLSFITPASSRNLLYSEVHELNLFTSIDKFTDIIIIILKNIFCRAVKENPCQVLFRLHYDWKILGRLSST